MRSIGFFQGRKEAFCVQGLAVAFFVAVCAAQLPTAWGTVVSKNFDRIQSNRNGIGFPNPWLVDQLIQNTPAIDFVNSDGSVDPTTVLGGSTLPYHQTVDPFNSWAVRIDDPSFPVYLSDPAILYLDLGKREETNGLIVWNSNQGDQTGTNYNDPGSGGAGLKRAKLYYLDESDSWDFDNNVMSSTLSWTPIGEFNFNPNNSLYSPSETKPFSAVHARAFKFELLESHGAPSWVVTSLDTNGDPVAVQQQLIWLGELAFTVSGGAPPTPPLNPVPEPSSLMVFAGLAALGIRKRLRLASIR